jgi:hypothetical protein
MESVYQQPVSSPLSTDLHAGIKPLWSIVLSMVDRSLFA